MRFLPLILLVGVTQPLLADTPRMPTPRITVSSSGRCFFTLLPPQFDGRDGTTRKPFGVAYKLEESGALHELWRTEGWYAFTCFLSDNGLYLVVLNDSPMGHELSKDPALLFYDRGKLLGQFSTADLVKDKTKVRSSASHYQWLFDPSDLEDELPAHPAGPNYADQENEFVLTTIDGVSYTFDATWGKLRRVNSSLCYLGRTSPIDSSRSLDPAHSYFRH
jgi:hypothetical protein